MSGSIAYPSARTRVDHAMIHYTHGRTAGEMAKRSHGASWRDRDAQPQSKETTMFRTFLTAAALILSVAAAQASDSLADRVHAAAEKACAPEAAPGMRPASHYDAIFKHCVYRISNSAMTKYQAAARAKAVQNDRLAGN